MASAANQDCAKKPGTSGSMFAYFAAHHTVILLAFVDDQVSDSVYFITCTNSLTASRPASTPACASVWVGAEHEKGLDGREEAENGLLLHAY